MNIIKINDNSNKLYYIGGIVRDELLGRESFDIDITYVGNAIEYCSKFGEVIQENPDFGTVKVEVWRDRGIEDKLFNDSDISEIQHVQQTDNSYSSNPLFFQSSIVDFASTRSESYPRKGHLPVVEKIGCSLKEDVMRRDFTINALAKSVTTGEIIDYAGGLEDLKNKKLRVLHDESFIDDPTRIIRGLKFSVRFGFDLEEHTKKLQDEYLANINYDMSYKRVKKELIETFNLNSQKAFEKFINEKIYKLVTPNDVELPSVNIEELVEEYILEGKRIRGLEGKLFNDNNIGEIQQIQQTDNSHTSIPPYLQPSENGLPSCPPALRSSDIPPSPQPSPSRGEGACPDNPSTLQPFNLSTNNSHTSIPPYLHTSENGLPSCPPALLTSVWLIYVGVLQDLSRLPLTKIEQKILDEVPKIEPKTDFEIYKMFENLRIESILLYAILVNEKIARHYLDNLRQIKIEITGEDLKNLGIPPSPKYQEIFDEILKEKLKNPNMTKEDEIDYIKKRYRGLEV